MRRDDEDHIAEMERFGRRPTEKWEVSEYRAALTKVILYSEGFGACWEYQGCELLGVLGSDRAGHGGDCQGGDQGGGGQEEPAAEGHHEGEN